MRRVPGDQLSHYGVKGMKWGVRKDSVSKGRSSRTSRSEPEVVLREKLKDGGSLTVTKNPPPRLAQFIAKYSKAAAQNVENSASFTLKDAQNNDVGMASFMRTSPTSLNLDWITVKTPHRGKGYASAAMRGVIQYARDNGITRLDLEVPGNSPDALHIYERLGFKTDTRLTTSSDDAWGGLQSMYLNVEQESVRHDDTFTKSILEYIVEALNESTEDDSLSHYGVKGMKWGVRKDRKARRNRSRAPQSKEHKRAQHLKKKKLSQMTNQEIATLNKRQELERKYRDLNPGTIAKGRRAVDNAFTVVGYADKGMRAYDGPIGRGVRSLVGAYFRNK